VPEHGSYSPPVRPPPKETPPERPQLSLVGTIVGRAAGFGLFVDPATKAVVRLKTGSAYRGWVLRTVREREVVLEKSHLSATITLPAPGRHLPVMLPGKGRGHYGRAVGPAPHDR
jgi:general secretion pathway protein N